jgi:hypothetical protein
MEYREERRKKDLALQHCMIARPDPVTAARSIFAATGIS